MPRNIEDLIRTTPIIDSLYVSLDGYAPTMPIPQWNFYDKGCVTEGNDYLIIDKMAEYILENDIDENICKNVPLRICEKYNDGKCKECIKQFFRNVEVTE